MSTQSLVNIGSSNGLLPDGIKPSITWTDIDLSPKLVCGIRIRKIPQDVFITLIATHISQWFNTIFRQ